MMTPIRVRPEVTRESITHHFVILSRRRDDVTPEEVDGYVTVGFFPDGNVCEIFCKLDKQGSAYSGFVDAWAISVSLLLQHGIPLADIIHRFKGMKFPPCGPVKGLPFNQQAKSPVDYVCRYLERFVTTQNG